VNCILIDSAHAGYGEFGASIRPRQMLESNLVDAACCAPPSNGQVPLFLIVKTMTSVRVVGRRGWQSLLANGSLVFVVFLVAGCTSSTPATIAQPTPSVTVAAVESREIVDFDEYTGKTEASEIVEIRSRIFGFLKSIDFTDGQYVED
jgi:hypothetical protein